ncbi:MULTISPECIES: type II toxin-antitoxin system VapB family antitoxin [unclassified Streptomyces]|uniref:type II toxin-antitoxin system VapB family antitoxin n=1 Tax=unclassified Streptomyces TaxID=2593676 RepID=UPI00131A1B98|nr:type II toxin-antitoxin system VapB family antitoxin [Streptomyces sp. SPB074]
MPKKSVDIDPDLLAAAMKKLGTTTIKETVNAALRAVADQGKRENAITDLSNMISSGRLDWDQLDEKSNYRPSPGEPSEQASEANIGHLRESLRRATDQTRRDLQAALLAVQFQPRAREAAKRNLAALLAERPAFRMEKALIAGSLDYADPSSLLPSTLEFKSSSEASSGHGEVGYTVTLPAMDLLLRVAKEVAEAHQIISDTGESGVEPTDSPATRGSESSE